MLLELLRQVRAAEPARPSSLSPGLDQDLETICLKCLEKDPAKRYNSALALAEDLERWLRGEPIIARPSSRTEQVVKWVRRRPTATALLLVSMVALVTLVSGSIAFTLRLQDQVYETEQAREDADNKANQLTIQATQLTIQIKETDQARKDANEKAEKLREKAVELKNKSDSLDQALRQSNRLLVDGRIQLVASALRDGQINLARDRLDEVPPKERFWDRHYLKRQQEGSLFTLYGHSRLDHNRVTIGRVRTTTSGASLMSRVRQVQECPSPSGSRGRRKRKCPRRLGIGARRLLCSSIVPVGRNKT